MKRTADADSTSHETKKQSKEFKASVPILALCFAAAKATVSPTPFARAIHIPKSPIADPSLLVQLHATLMRGIDLENEKRRQPVLQCLAQEFPLTRHRRVIAAIHCIWKQMNDSHHSYPLTIVDDTCEELRKWTSPREFDYLLIHFNTTAMRHPDAQELLLQTPSIFARYLETMPLPLPDSFVQHVNWLVHDALVYKIQFAEFTESAVYPNLRAIFANYATRTTQRLHFDLEWLFWNVRSLPLIQAVWPLIDMSKRPDPVPIALLEHAPPETLEWIIENMPRSVRVQFVAEQLAQARKIQRQEGTVYRILRAHANPNDFN